MKVEYSPTGICPNKIEFEIVNEKIYNIKFHGGCPGNTKMIAKLLNGWNAQKIIDVCENNLCGNKSTSCADQLAKAIKSKIKEKITN